MSSAQVLAIRGLERTYVSGDRTLTVLSGVDLDVQPGEIVGLVGPSGSGKSSLLHAAGLLEVRGRVNCGAWEHIFVATDAVKVALYFAEVLGARHNFLSGVTAFLKTDAANLVKIGHLRHKLLFCRGGYQWNARRDFKPMPDGGSYR